MTLEKRCGNCIYWSANHAEHKMCKSFEKIISFKTITSNGQIILKIIMRDSSEREYKLSSADAFITWYNRTVATCNIGNTCYEFTDPVDGSTEYLAFDKIISFEVIPIA